VERIVKDTVYKRVIDTMDRLVVTQSNRLFTKEEIKNTDNEEIAHLRLELERSNIKVKNLENLINTKIIVADTIKGDSTYIGNDLISANGRTEFMRYGVDIFPLTEDHLFWYAYTNELTYISHWHRKNIFSRKELRLTVISADSNTMIQNSTYTVKQKPTRAVVGLGVGYGYSVYSNRFEPQININLSYPLLTF
jgi:hypothetical protein